MNKENIATGETSQANTPFHFFDYFKHISRVFSRYISTLISSSKFDTKKRENCNTTDFATKKRKFNCAIELSGVDVVCCGVRLRGVEWSGWSGIN